MFRIENKTGKMLTVVVHRDCVEIMTDGKLDPDRSSKQFVYGYQGIPTLTSLSCASAVDGKGLN